MFPRTETVCFDLDDTLFDYGEYADVGFQAAAAVIERRTGEQLYDELVELYFEAGIREGTFDRLVERHDLPSDLVPDLVAAFHDSTGQLPLYSDTEAVLDALADDYLLGLLTDGRNGHAKLTRLGLDGRFDAVLVTHGHDFSKRDAVAFERLLDDLNADPTRTVYVGDNPRTDFRHPNDLGMGTVRLLRGRYVDREPRPDESPDVTIDRLDELTQLVA